MFKRTRFRGGRSLALGSVLVAGCGSAAVIATANAHKYATTPVSSGALNLKALPLGDGYVSTTPKLGYVDSCQTHFGGIGGAQVNGPWINTKAKTWDYTTKIAVNGAIHWPTGSYSVKAVGGKRVLKFNDLPINHTTGVFPIASTDPAFKYDHNGNHIAAQSVNWSLPLNPTAASRPSCSGPIGVLKDGVFLFNALDGEGRDAAAHEVLDLCAGHPDPSDSYHHHDVPPCILNKAPNGRATLVGYALDGYGIYVVKSDNGTMPTNLSLDACHGTTSQVLWNGRMTRVYHYVATLEYPYTVGCFHGTAISSGHGGGTGGHGGAAPVP
jgi:hypothetical protein